MARGIARTDQAACGPAQALRLPNVGEVAIEVKSRLPAAPTPREPSGTLLLPRNETGASRRVAARSSCGPGC